MDLGLLKNKKVIALIVIVILINIAEILWVTHTADNIINKKDNNVYMICDVYDVVTNGNRVQVDIELPNGELLTKQLSVDNDLPEEFEEVVIQTSDLDDYSTYKIVGMR